MAKMAALNFSDIENTLANLKKLENTIQNGMLATKECAMDCEENDEGCPEVKSLKQVMLEYANFSREISQWEKAVRKTVSAYRKNPEQKLEESLDMEKTFDEFLKKEQEGNSPEDLENNKFVKEFVEHIWNVNHSGKDENVNDGELAGDEDLLISQVVGDRLLCPITKAEMDCPMKNKVCGHSYGKKAILEHVKTMRHRAKCPVVGCPNVVKSEDLEVDSLLARELKKRHK